MAKAKIIPAEKTAIRRRLMYDKRILVDDPESYEEERLQGYFVIVGTAEEITRISKRLDNFYRPVLRQSAIGREIPFTDFRYFVKIMTLRAGDINRYVLRKYIYNPEMKEGALLIQSEILSPFKENTEGLEKKMRDILIKEVQQKLKFKK